MKLILASNNKEKLAELKAILSDVDVELLSQREAGCDFEVDETGTSFDENAYLKAEAVFRATGCATIADDSGLMVDALNGEPGVYSARYAPGGHSASYEDVCNYLLYKLEGVEDRSAKFVTHTCCIMPNGDIIRTKGECRGEIIKESRGEGGFGYDPVFRPEGFDETMAELGTELKNAISHRAMALKEFKKKLREYNGTDK